MDSGRSGRILEGERRTVKATSPARRRPAVYQGWPLGSICTRASRKVDSRHGAHAHALALGWCDLMTKKNRAGDDWLSLSYAKRRAFTAEVVRRYGMTCCICGLPIKSVKDLSVQHTTPRSKGGITSLATCRPAHRRCNSSMRDREASGAPIDVIHDGLAAFVSEK